MHRLAVFYYINIVMSTRSDRFYAEFVVSFPDFMLYLQLQPALDSADRIPSYNYCLDIPARFRWLSLHFSVFELRRLQTDLSTCRYGTGYKDVAADHAVISDHRITAEDRGV